MIIKYHWLQCVQMLNKSRTYDKKHKLLSEHRNLDKNQENSSIWENERPVQTEGHTSTAIKKPTVTRTSYHITSPMKTLESSSSISSVLKPHTFDPDISTKALRHLQRDKTKALPSFSNKPCHSSITPTSYSTSLLSFFSGICVPRCHIIHLLKLRRSRLNSEATLVVQPLLNFKFKECTNFKINNERGKSNNLQGWSLQCIGYDI